MHGSEIQAKYGNGAWKICTLIYPGKYYTMPRFFVMHCMIKELAAAHGKFYLQKNRCA